MIGRSAGIAIAATIFGTLAAAAPALAAPFVAGHYLLTLNVTSDTTCTDVTITGVPSGWIFAYTGPSEPGSQMRTNANIVIPGQNGAASTNTTEMVAFKFPTSPPVGSAKWLGNMSLTVVQTGNTPQTEKPTVQTAPRVPFEFIFVFIDANSFTGTFKFTSIDTNTNGVCEVVSQVTADRLGG